MSDSEIFSIKDPRPITAKFRSTDSTKPQVYFSDSDCEQSEINKQCGTESKDNIENDKYIPKIQRECNKIQCSQSSMSHEAHSGNKPRSRSRKGKAKKKGYKRISSHDNSQSNNASIYLKSKDTDRKANKLLKSESYAKARKKKKIMVGDEKQTEVLDTQQSAKTTIIPSDTQAKSPEKIKIRKPNLEHLAKLAEKKGCGHKDHHGAQMFHPQLSSCTSEEQADPLASGNVVKPDEEEDLMVTGEIGNSNEMEVHQEELRHNQMDETESLGANQVALSTEPRPRLRCTNLSLSMPNTREGRRKPEIEEDSNNWLFECRNIWSGRKGGKGKHYSNNYLKTTQNSQGQGHTKYESKPANQVVSGANSLPKSNRFIYSMKNKNTNKAPMRTVKQGTFVLMGTMKSIGFEV